MVMKIQTISGKQIGIIIIIFSLILLALMISITEQLNQSIHSECVCGPGVCPMTSNLPIQSYIGFTAVIILAGFGAFLILNTRRIEAIQTGIRREFENVIKTLTNEEREIYESIKNADGVLFQGDLVEKSGFSKVKITRILDRLEAKKLIERRRRGMTNLVLAKR